jgi:hypothetical protein
MARVSHEFFVRNKCHQESLAACSFLCYNAIGFPTHCPVIALDLFPTSDHFQHGGGSTEKFRSRSMESLESTTATHLLVACAPAPEIKIQDILNTLLERTRPCPDFCSPLITSGQDSPPSTW